MAAEEVPLHGGNMNAGVVRVGDTVRRPAGPWTPAVHALLAHLHAAGFRGAPRPLGIDEQGREVLTFVPGLVAWPEHFGLLRSGRALLRAARLIREFHSAMAGFVPPEDARWQALMPAEGSDIIAHQDLAPWNLIVNDDQWAFIDWDTAAPGSRLWDLAYAMHGFVPLNAGMAPAEDEACGRLRLMADGYGLGEDERELIIPMLARRASAMRDFLTAREAAGNEPWATMARSGHLEAWRADTAWITTREDRWRHALLG